MPQETPRDSTTPPDLGQEPEPEPEENRSQDDRTYDERAAEDPQANATSDGMVPRQPTPEFDPTSTEFDPTSTGDETGETL